MLYWECKRRLALLRRFHEQITAYFGNIEYASWMVGGGPNENKTAQNARREINMMMRDVAESLDSHGIPQDVLYQHPPALRLPSQVVDVIQNIFILYQYKDLGSERVFDCVERGIGSYETECRELKHASLNPFYWFGLLLKWFLGLPFKALGVMGFDLAENSKAGRIVKVGAFVGYMVTLVAGIVQIAQGWPTVRSLLRIH